MGTETHPRDMEQPMPFVLMLTPAEAGAFARDLMDDNDVTTMEREVAAQVLTQLPVRLPEKVGAVVQSSDGGFFLRWSYDSHTTQPWISAVDLDNPLRSEDLPLITKIYFEGVDL
jgi:hypothetical protein